MDGACSPTAAPAAGDERPLDADSVFEIGSVTKVFTALLLAEMAARGEVALEDPVAKFLPGRVKMPAKGRKRITLLDLATYTSGLPRMPFNFDAKATRTIPTRIILSNGFTSFFPDTR